MKIAMWSGPRNLSTAMMYSFANREDFVAIDEPFYAAYLSATGADHPMKEEILASQSRNFDQVISSLFQPDSTSRHQYQKHQTQHMIPELDRSWLSDVTNIFLIRHPARVLASYSIKRANPTLADIGFTQQLELFQQVSSIDDQPLVVDAFDIRANPSGMLRAICDRVGLEFDPAMLEWPKGPKPFDGVWASHWYGSAHQSTGFAPLEGALPALEKAQWPILDQAMECYDQMSAYKLRL